MKTRTKILLGLGTTLVLTVIAAAVWFIVLRDDGPDAATSESAIEAAQDQQNTTEAGPIHGTWTIDTTFGDNEFPYTNNTYVGYRVVEELASIGGFTAVGRTTVVSGNLEINGTQISGVNVLADVSRLTSDTRARDEIIKTQALESATFTESTFVLTQAIELGQIPADGETITADAIGDLTLHGVTNQVTIPIEATLVGGNTIAVVGTAPVEFADYDIEPPTAAIVLSIGDKGELELQLFFTK